MGIELVWQKVGCMGGVLGEQQHLHNQRGTEQLSKSPLSGWRLGLRWGVVMGEAGKVRRFPRANARLTNLNFIPEGLGSVYSLSKEESLKKENS